MVKGEEGGAVAVVMRKAEHGSTLEELWILLASLPSTPCGGIFFFFHLFMIVTQREREREAET